MHRRPEMDHVVVYVRDLDRAIRDYTGLGFNVAPGGVHAGGATGNALIPFADGSYLELLAFRRHWVRRLLPGVDRIRGATSFLWPGRPPMEIRFRSRARGVEGLLDYALRVDSLPAALEMLRREGLRADGPVEGSRTGEDGEVVTWEMAFPNARELPFLCSDVTPLERRVPEGEAREHPNGATGIARLTVAVESLEVSSARYRAMFAREPEPAPTEEIGGARGRVFRMEGADILLITPEPRNDDLKRHLRERGEGPVAIRLSSEEGAPARVLDPHRSHGARIQLGG